MLLKSCKLPGRALVAVPQVQQWTEVQEANNDDGGRATESY